MLFNGTIIMKNFSSLNDNMFFCVPWDNAQHRSTAKGYKIIISDVIYGNAARTLMQIHIAIMRGDRVVTMSELFQTHAPAKQEHHLKEFEENLWQCVSRNVTFKEGLLDCNIVKIWYYQPETLSQNDSTTPKLYCRIALTTANICAPDTNSENQILSSLREYLLDFINQI